MTKGPYESEFINGMTWCTAGRGNTESRGVNGHSFNFFIKSQ